MIPSRLQVVDLNDIRRLVDLVVGNDNEINNETKQLS
jgi:hypothetical protein